MKIRNGIDIVEISRMAKAIQKEKFLLRVFTENERDYCDSRGSGRSASYAARWAAKEAVMKLLGTGFAGGAINEIEVLHHEATEEPRIALHGQFKQTAENLGISEEMIAISLSHAKEYAVAVASCLIQK